jgi:hypothetical protein
VHRLQPSEEGDVATLLDPAETALLLVAAQAFTCTTRCRSPNSRPTTSGTARRPIPVSTRMLHLVCHPHAGCRPLRLLRHRLVDAAHPGCTRPRRATHIVTLSAQLGLGKAQVDLPHRRHLRPLTRIRIATRTTLPMLLSESNGNVGTRRTRAGSVNKPSVVRPRSRDDTLALPRIVVHRHLPRLQGVIEDVVI